MLGGRGKPGSVPVSDANPSWLEGILGIRNLQSENVSIFLQFPFPYRAEGKPEGNKALLRTASLSVLYKMVWRGARAFCGGLGRSERGWGLGKCMRSPPPPPPGPGEEAGGREKQGLFLQE